MAISGQQTHGTAWPAYTKDRLQNARMKIQSLDLAASECDGPPSLTRSQPVPTCMASNPCSWTAAGGLVDGSHASPLRQGRSRCGLGTRALGPYLALSVPLLLSTRDAELRAAYRWPLSGWTTSSWLCSHPDLSNAMPSDPFGTEG
jgi:hypothetical protein